MTEQQTQRLVEKIVKFVKNAPWKEIVALGINAQIAQKIRKGEPFKFRATTLERLKKKFDKVA